MPTRQEIINNAITNSKLNAMSLTASVQLKLLETEGVAGEIAAAQKESIVKQALEEALREEINTELANQGEFRLSNEELEGAVDRLPQLMDADDVNEFWLDKFWDALEDLSDLLGPSDPDWDRDYDGIPDTIDIDPNTNHWFQRALSWVPRRDPSH